MLAMNPQLKKYAEEDLFNELKYLLCAATEWDAHDKLIGEPSRTPKMNQPCFHLSVYTMDSALLHARSLYEFFTAGEGSINRNNDQGWRRLTWRDYSPNSRQQSATYQQFMKPLHGRVMHIEKDRAGYDEIKKEVVTLAQGILTLWAGFSRTPGLAAYATLLGNLRDAAVRAAEGVANQYQNWGYKSPFS